MTITGPSGAHSACHEFPQLETERLLLREVSAEDCAALFQNYTDPQVTEYFMEPLTDQQQAAAIVE